MIKTQKLTKLNHKNFQNILTMFTSSSSEDFFLALQIWDSCEKNTTLNTIIAKHISKGNYEDPREMHKRLLEFTKVYCTLVNSLFHLDTTFHLLVNKMIEKDGNHKFTNKIIKKFVIDTVNTLIAYHNLLEIVKIKEKNIKI